jgi:hypothetical protein
MAGTTRAPNAFASVKCLKSNMRKLGVEDTHEYFQLKYPTAGRLNMARWSNLEMDVGMLAAKFPQSDSPHWAALRDCVDLIKAVLRKANEEFATVEEDRDLSAQGMDRQRAAIARRVLSELDAFAPMTKAENTSARRIEALEKQTTALPSVPSAAIDAMLAAEIRRHVSKQERPELYVLKHAADPRVVGAVIHAPSFLSGMKDSDVALIKAEVGRTMHPLVAEEKQKIERALDVCRNAMSSAQRLIESRAGMRKDADGVLRHNTQQAPTSVS